MGTTLKMQQHRPRMLALALLVALQIAFAEPPLGPTDRAKCPVTGADINITSDTPRVAFTHGQVLFFSSRKAASEYSRYPRDFWFDPHTKPLPGLDGKRGLPNLRNQTVTHRAAFMLVLPRASPGL